jgi:hypothetical protein
VSCVIVFPVIAYTLDLREKDNFDFERMRLWAFQKRALALN